MILDLAAANDAAPQAAEPIDSGPADHRALQRQSGITLMNTLLGAIYDGPSESPPWRSVLHALREALRAKHISLVLHPALPESPGIRFKTDTAIANGSETFRTHVFALDPFPALPPGQVHTAHEIHGAEWATSVLHRDYLLPLDVGALLGADIRTKDGTDCKIRVARDARSPPFSREERALCRMLLPHLQRAIELHLRLDGLDCEQQFYSGVIDRLELGIIGLAGNGSIVDINAEARRLLEQKDGLSADSATNNAKLLAENRQLHALVHEAIRADGAQTPPLLRGLRLKRASGRRPLGILLRSVAPGKRGEVQARPAAVVFLRDPDAGSQLSDDLLQQHFGFSRTEAALAMHLMQGLSLGEAANQLGLKSEVARSYLRFVFSKTGVTRQTMLVRKLVTTMASLG